MKCAFRSLLVALLALSWACFGAFKAYRAMFGPEVPHDIHMSVSSDGQWRCVVMDTDPDVNGKNLVFRIEPVGEPHAHINGDLRSCYVGVNFSPSDLQFEWGEHCLLVWFKASDRAAFLCEFGESSQHWREIPFAYPQERPMISKAAQ